MEVEIEIDRYHSRSSQMETIIDRWIDGLIDRWTDTLTDQQTDRL